MKYRSSPRGVIAHCRAQPRLFPSEPRNEIFHIHQVYIDTNREFSSANFSNVCLENVDFDLINCCMWFFFFYIERSLWFFRIDRSYIFEENESRKRVISARYFNLIYVDFDCLIYTIINIFFSIKRNLFLYDFCINLIYVNFDLIKWYIISCFRKDFWKKMKKGRKRVLYLRDISSY